MKTTPVSFADLSGSVMAVPPLCRDQNMSLAPAANRALVRHIESGGISTLLYGGNANLYNMGLREYPAMLDLLAEIAAPNTWMIPSAGPDFGRLMDQVPLLRARQFPTVMVLPMTFPMTVDGAATGLRRFAEALGRPIIVYLKAEGYLTPALVAALVADGLVAAIKYAVVRPDPSHDPLLKDLCERVDRRLIVSGIGERPAITHVRDFGVAGFTSGSACVAPRGSMALLGAIAKRDWAAAESYRRPYLPLEDLRDAHSPIRVLHEAVRLADIADTGPMLPLLSNVDVALHPALTAAAQALRAADAAI